MTHKSAFRNVTKDYEQARTKAETLLEERRAKVYESIPQVAEIDRSLARLGMSLAKMALDGNEAGIAKARAEMEDLKDVRQTLLADSFGENYLTAVYRCAACQDTGYIQASAGSPVSRCNCLKQRLINEYYAMSNIKGALEDENFDTFDIRLFSTEIVPEEGLSPSANMENVYRLATKFVENFDTEFSNLLLYGDTGLGKTFVCHCIAKDLLDAGKTVLYQTAPRLCKVLEDYRFNRDSMTEPDEMLEAIDEVDLLILDDLGSEMVTIVTQAALFEIINQRMITRKHTVISTNLSLAMLHNDYSERIVSRFIGKYEMIKFFGEDIRVKRKYGGVRI